MQAFILLKKAFQISCVLCDMPEYKPINLNLFLHYSSTTRTEGKLTKWPVSWLSTNWLLPFGPGGGELSCPRGMRVGQIKNNFSLIFQIMCHFLHGLHEAAEFKTTYFQGKMPKRGWRGINYQDLSLYVAGDDPNKQTRNKTSRGVSQQVRLGTILRAGKTRKPRKTKGDG